MKLSIKFKSLINFLILAFLIVGCGSQKSAPAAAVATPVIGEPKVGAPSPQQPGEEIGISIDISSGSGVALNYSWNADGGEIIRGQGSPAITYRVSDEPGTYNIKVKVEWDGQSVEKVTSVKVEAEATETPTPEPPTVTPTPEPPTNTPIPPTNTPTQEPTSTPEPTNTLIPEPTSTSTSTPIPKPTDTPRPTFTPTPQLLTMRPGCGDTYTVASNTPIKLQYGGWETRGVEIAQNQANHLTVTLLLDDEVIPGQRQPFGPFNTLYPGASCGGAADIEDAFGDFSIAYINSLDPGEYSAEVIYSFDEQVIDGYDSDGDGNPDTYGPGEAHRLRFTIIAEP